jgi:transcriptional regulator with GAF, ATPase, and Fis domain
MNSSVNRIKSIATACAELLDEEQRAQANLLAELIDAVRILQGDTSDQRLRQLSLRLKELQTQGELLPQLARERFLAPIQSETAAIQIDLNAARLGRVLSALTEQPSVTLRVFCEKLLDQLLVLTNAERGFLLYYLPESTEAEIVAARHFETTNLSLAEYDISRTLLREIFARGEPLLVEDAMIDPAYGREASVQRLEIKSVLAAPLMLGTRTVGAVYLENRTRPSIFRPSDCDLLQALARFVVFYLQHARLLPVALSSVERVFLDGGRASDEIIGRDQKLQAARKVVDRIADSQALVLIEGESGTGKELFARALHYQSSRRDGPFAAINCAAIPENLLESELFGHERGAFTGATERYIGRIEQGRGGTLFLDEVSELALPLQAKLLRFLQGNELQRLGGKETVHVDVRVVAATSKNLKTLAEAGKFHESLFYRLNVIPLHLPSLRERREDIPLLAAHYANKFSALYQKDTRIEDEVYECLRDYCFPGNVRELENLMHRLIALAEGDAIRLGDLPPEILKPAAQRVALQSSPLTQLLSTPPSDYPELRRRRSEIKRLLSTQEREMIDRTIHDCNGNLTKAARRLGIHRITLHKILGKGG